MTKNNFIDYLNSTNNISGDSTGSLAEKQVTSNYFDAMNIDRKLGEIIHESITEKKNEVFILTGHAGDGKTSILAQVLRKLGTLDTTNGLSDENKDKNKGFYYVKDMSEIPSAKQEDTLRAILEAPKEGYTSLLISNTGPLLKSMISLLKTDAINAGTSLSNEKELEIQNSLLQQLDKNGQSSLTIEKYTFRLINIARLDNVSFSTKILEKLTANNLWSPCSQCTKQDACPVFFNYKTLLDNIDQVSYFIENFYRYLFECDKRMTIRQMLGQISFSITGNLNCELVHENTYNKFDYNFANLFFGYVGTTEKTEFRQIKGIDQIRILDLDGISFQEDYEILIEKNPNYYPQKLKNLLEPMKQYSTSSDTKIRHLEDREKRKAIRRFFLLYQALPTPEMKDHFTNQLYGEQFSNYRDCTMTTKTSFPLMQISTLIFEALYMRNTGFMYSKSSNTPLPLTLRRDQNSYQSVMLILGKIEKGNLNVEQKPLDQSFEEQSSSQRQQLVLKVNNNDKEFPLSYPLIAYFTRLSQGDISGINSPSLTHGIAALDALLIEEYASSTSSNKFAVLYQTKKGQKEQRFDIADDILSVN